MCMYVCVCAIRFHILCSYANTHTQRHREKKWLSEAAKSNKLTAKQKKKHKRITNRQIDRHTNRQTFFGQCWVYVWLSVCVCYLYQRKYITCFQLAILAKFLCRAMMVSCWKIDTKTTATINMKWNERSRKESNNFIAKSTKL